MTIMACGLWHWSGRRAAFSDHRERSDGKPLPMKLCSVQWWFVVWHGVGRSCISSHHGGGRDGKPIFLGRRKIALYLNDAQQCIALLSQCQELKEKEGEKF
jgi:hypothetical protein